MEIEDETSVGAVLILANSGFHQRRVFHPRKAQRHVGPGFLHRFRHDGPVAVGRIESRAAAIVGDLEAAPLVSGYAIEGRRPVVDPAWNLRFIESGIAWFHPEEEDLLARRPHAIADRIRKNLAQPW